MVDPNGEDAIWLQDQNAVWGMGHTGLLIQDKGGTWYHFYWGRTGTGKLGKSGATGEVKSLGRFRYSNRTQLNNYLNKNGIYSGKYESLIYFRGDFSASLQYAKQLKRGYNLLWDNCMQLSVDVLSKGSFAQNNKQYKSFLKKISFNPVPNCAYISLRNFHSIVVRYNSAPMYLRAFYINPTKAVLMC